MYYLRTNKHFTLKTKPLKRSDLDEFVTCYKPGKRHQRKPLWTEETLTRRWRSLSYEEPDEAPYHDPARQADEALAVIELRGTEQA